MPSPAPEQQRIPCAPKQMKLETPSRLVEGFSTSPTTQASRSALGGFTKLMGLGTRSLVMSMWQVPDRETKELMVEFYKNIRSGTMNRCQALRQAALKQLKTVKDRYGSANPFFWGAFVFMGEP